MLHDINAPVDVPPMVSADVDAEVVAEVDAEVSDVDIVVDPASPASSSALAGPSQSGLF